jgi:copper transport protein
MSVAPRRAPLTIVLVLLVVLGGATINGLAHAELKASSPASGERLVESPLEIWLSFTEPVEPDLTRIEILDAEQVSHPLGPLGLEDDNYRVRLELEQPLAPGGYLISWETVSRLDGHRTFGTIPFVIGDNATLLDAQERGEQSLRVDSTLGKALIFAGLAGSIGVFAFWAACMPRSSRQTMRQPLRRTGIISPWLLLGGSLLLLGSQVSILGVSPMTYLMGTTSGRFLAARIALVVTLIAFWHLEPRLFGREDEKDRWIHAWPLVAGILVLTAASSHSAGALNGSGVLIDALHLLALGAWIGGLVLLLLFIGQMNRKTGPPSEADAALTRRFSWLAFWMVLLVSATGILMTLSLVGSDASTWSSSDYARLLGVKIGLMVLMVLIGATNKFLYVARTKRSGLDASTLKGLRRNVRAEAVTAVLILLIAGAMTTLAPPLAGAAGDAGDASSSDMVEVDDVPQWLVLEDTTQNYEWTVTLHPPPAVEQDVHYIIELFDPSTQSRERDARSVVIRATWLEDPDLGDSRIDAKVTQRGTYEAVAANFPFPGTYRLTITVDTPVAYQETFSKEILVE